MADRKMRKSESLQEYFLQMKELASRENIESSALIQYVIDGMDDTCGNKLVLYNAKSLIEFKDKLKCFEVIRGKSKSENKNQVMYSKANHTEAKNDYKKQAVPNRNASRDLKCYNCGAKGHTSANCENKTKGRKCFQCNNFGHIVKKCSEKGLCEKWKKPTCVSCYLLMQQQPKWMESILSQNSGVPAVSKL